MGDTLLWNVVNDAKLPGSRIRINDLSFNK